MQQHNGGNYLALSGGVITGNLSVSNNVSAINFYSNGTLLSTYQAGNYLTLNTTTNTFNVSAQVPSAISATNTINFADQPSTYYATSAQINSLSTQVSGISRILDEIISG